MALFKIQHGGETRLPSTKHTGWAYVTYDKNRMYIDVNKILDDKGTADSTTTRIQLYDYLDNMVMKSDVASQNKIAYYNDSGNLAVSNLVTDATNLTVPGTLIVKDTSSLVNVAVSSTLIVSGKGTFQGGLSVTAGNITNTITGTGASSITTTNDNGSVALQSETNRGLYDAKNKYWIINVNKNETKARISTWASIGSATNPVYFDANGQPVKTTYSLNAGISSASVANKLAYYSSTTEISAVTNTYGSNTKPVYVNAGVLTASTATVGSATKPVYMDAGSITVCDHVVEAGAGLETSGIIIKHNSSIKAGSFGTDSDTATSGTEFYIPYFAYNETGHIIKTNSHKHTISAADLGLSNAMHFIGKATKAITDGGTEDPGITGYIAKTAGDVVLGMDGEFEYVWTLAKAWEKLGGDSSYKVVQSAVNSPAANGSATAFIDTISQDANGNISVTKKNLDTSGEWSGTAGKAKQLATARTINGTSFDGTKNITTANWGTARTITIGDTGKTINGSGNVSWTLKEIGAAAASHSHSYLPLAGGTMTGAIKSNYLYEGSWVTASGYAPFFVNVTSTASAGYSYQSWFGGKTQGGSWTMGFLTGHEDLYFSYVSSSDTSDCHQVHFGSDGSVYGAVWNDYAEFRKGKEEIKPGYCVFSNDDGIVQKTTKKFQACDGIVSDTFGFAIGETNECKTPLAVAGRVLAYYSGDRNNYHAGDTICAGPDGKVVKMTREEVRKWPDRIVGIVSEIPNYETWGSGNIEVDGRIWIKVK